MKKTVAKINKTKGWFFEKIKLINHQPISSRKKSRGLKSIKIRNEKGEVITDTAEIQNIIRDYCKQIYAYKIGNLEEMDKYLERYNLVFQD